MLLLAVIYLTQRERQHHREREDLAQPSPNQQRIEQLELELKAPLKVPQEVEQLEQEHQQLTENIQREREERLVIGGGELAGLAGVIFAIPLLAVARVFFDFFRARIQTTPKAEP